MLMFVHIDSTCYVQIWDMNTFTCTKTLKGHDHTISCVVFVQSGDQLVTGSRDQTIKMWEVSTGYCVRTLNGHSDWIKAIALSLDGQYLASGGVDQQIVVWNLTSGAAVQVTLLSFAVQARHEIMVTLFCRRYAVTSM